MGVQGIPEMQDEDPNKGHVISSLFADALRAIVTMLAAFAPRRRDAGLRPRSRAMG